LAFYLLPAPIRIPIPVAIPVVVATIITIPLPVAIPAAILSLRRCGHERSGTDKQRERKSRSEYSLH
jgi:hypothetical protein